MNSVAPDSLTYLQAEAKRLDLPPDRIHCLLTIDAFPSDEAPKVHKIADILDSTFTTILDEPLDEFSDPKEKWAGYRYEAIGCLKPEHPLSTRVRAATLEVFILGSFKVEDVELWYQRVRVPETSLYGEVQWRPGYREPKPFIGGWTARKPKPTEITLARRALGLIWAIEAHRTSAGRPPDDREAILDDMARRGVEWLQKHPRASIEDFGRKQLAEMLIMDYNSLKAKMRIKKIHNPDVHRRMQELAERGE